METQKPNAGRTRTASTAGFCSPANQGHTPVPNHLLQRQREMAKTRKREQACRYHRAGPRPPIRFCTIQSHLPGPSQQTNSPTATQHSYWGQNVSTHDELVTKRHIRFSINLINAYSFFQNAKCYKTTYDWVDYLETTPILEPNHVLVGAVL